MTRLTRRLLTVLAGGGAAVQQRHLLSRLSQHLATAMLSRAGRAGAKARAEAVAVAASLLLGGLVAVAAVSKLLKRPWPWQTQQEQLWLQPCQLALLMSTHRLQVQPQLQLLHNARSALELAAAAAAPQVPQDLLTHRPRVAALLGPKKQMQTQRALRSLHA